MTNPDAPTVLACTTDHPWTSPRLLAALHRPPEPSCAAEADGTGHSEGGAVDPTHAPDSLPAGIESICSAAEPDGDLVALLAQGASRRALEELMTRYGHAVYKVCAAGLGDRMLAEDVHQQIFLEIYRHLGTFQPRVPLRAWLFSIARHRVANAARSRGRERAHLAPEGAAGTPTNSRGPTTRFDDQLLRRALDATIAQLPDELQQLLRLRFQEGLSFEEIAALMGVPAGTLQRRLSRAMPRLRRDLQRALGRLAQFSP